VGHGLSARFIPTDKPGAQPAQDPDDGERDARPVLAIPEEKGKEDKKRQRVGEQVFLIGVEQGAEDDP
jgi:hypothetical protein